MYLLATNHFSHLITKGDEVRRRIAQVGEQAVSISLITEGEILYMAYNSEQQQRNLQIVQSYLASANIYRLNEEIADLYGQFKARIIRHFGPKDRQKRRRTKIASLGLATTIYGLPALRYIIT